MIKLPDEVKFIINKLKNADFDGYAVGGCIRDSLMGRQPKDWDIASSAAPEDFLKIFKNDKLVPTGLKHGTVTLIINKQHFELTTYRIDGLYSDGRRPDSVTFTDRLNEDLSRRDFTINAMAYNDENGLVDLFGGQDDLRDKIIRCVGKPDERFSEDYLRMLRAFRFASVLNFTLADDVYRACENYAEKISSVSAERIRGEFDKIVLSENKAGLDAFLRLFSKILFPEIRCIMGIEQCNKYHNKDVYEHTLAVFENVKNDLAFKLCAIFHDIGKPEAKATENGTDHFHGHEKLSSDMTKKILLRLKYDNNTISRVCGIIRFHGVAKHYKKAQIRHLINQAGYDIAFDVLEFSVGDLFGKNEFAIAKGRAEAETRFLMYDEIIANKEACLLKELKVNGKDLMALSPEIRGEKLGMLLDFLMMKVLENPELNNYDALMGMAKEEQ